MTLDGRFRRPAGRLSWPMRIGLGAAVVAVIAGALAGAALLLWLLVLLVPVALIAGVIAYVALRIQLWRGRGRHGGAHAVWRPPAPPR